MTFLTEAGHGKICNEAIFCGAVVRLFCEEKGGNGCGTITTNKQLKRAAVLHVQFPPMMCRMDRLVIALNSNG